ncbi:DUF1611 domain-containing protein [Merismopedia glauca]|uniref:DUF1611 domain-containing protein n=1 Tax=Merismopedia glauca CCAP 1448/3 TaxID=1296344 RepID=A0A2T1C727_9CYAN|nr:DUF1611 domain-containing protein [Merismopedia glauca]PSB03947.1 DUF1611 domain-containing protein [Merismopedia glauca CCAP 1448/3]
MLNTNDKIAILLHQGINSVLGKTGLAVLRYTQASVVAVIDLDNAGKSLKQLTGINKAIPIVASVQESLIYEPNVLLIGIAPSGGALPLAWWEEVREALIAGLSIVNGLHTPIASYPNVPKLLRKEQWIWEIRREPPGLSIAAAKARSLSCQRVLTVGTDMAIGKMSTSIELQRATEKRGIRAKFLATGQTGVMIAGSGIALDAVRVDFAAGAVEQMVMDCGDDCDILYIEGQGSLLHPGSTATLPLIRGSQPTALILVHRAGQTHVRNFPDVKIPPLTDVIKLYEMVAGCAGAFDPVKVVGIALNTAHLDDTLALNAIAQVEQETGLPCIDPVRCGADKLVHEVRR